MMFVFVPDALIYTCSFVWQYCYNYHFETQTDTFALRNSLHSFSPQELEISFATRPSHNTVGETWMPFCLENLTTATGRRIMISKNVIFLIEPLTGVLQLICYSDSAVRRGLMGQ